MSLLCIDCGNTRIKWGVRDGERWLTRGALAAGELPNLKEALPQAPARIVACNVAGAAAAAAVEALAAQLAVPLIWATSQARQCGVANGYAQPQQLGADRWAALIGAHALQGGPCLVVNAGTATTVDVLLADGRFAGGLILPGLTMMRAALAANTAGLPLADGGYRDLPDNTMDAIASGCLAATAGAIERMHRHVPAGPCLLSGGAADELAPLLNLPLRRVEDLVLEGLASIAGT